MYMYMFGTIVKITKTPDVRVFGDNIRRFYREFDFDSQRLGLPLSTLGVFIGSSTRGTGRFLEAHVHRKSLILVEMK